MPPGTPHNLPAHKYKCIVDMKINGLLTQTLIDTGATSSAISTRLLECFPNAKNLIHRRTPKICMAMNGQPLKSLYTVMLPIVLKGGKCLHHQFEVINGLINPALLGTDFLKAQEAKLDFSQNSLQLGKHCLPFQIAEWSPPQPAHLVTFEDTVLPPNSISLVRAQISGSNPCLTEKIDDLLIGPLCNYFDTDFIASYSVINPNASEIIVEILNPLDKPIHLPEGQPIADVQGQNSDITQTDVWRDLQQMPSDLSEKGETEDFCDGLPNVFKCANEAFEKECSSFEPPDPSFTPVFSDPTFASHTSTPTHSPSLQPHEGFW